MIGLNFKISESDLSLCSLGKAYILAVEDPVGYTLLYVKSSVKNPLALIFRNYLLKFFCVTNYIIN